MQNGEQYVEVRGSVSPGRKIAYNIIPGKGPAGIFWMSGFQAHMRGKKANALADQCSEQGYSFTRFDYSGRGSSEGRPEDGTISRWLEEARTIFIDKTEGPQIVVGSSMGGWLALLLMKTLASHKSRFSGGILLAPAWNMTETLMWERFSDEIRAEIEQKGVYYRPSAYGPYAITKRLIEDGRSHLIRPEELRLGCPLAILQGMRDPIVPWRHSLEFVQRVNQPAVALELIKDGDHSLSRGGDIARLFAVLGDMMNRNFADRHIPL